MTGLGAVTPLGNSREEFWRRLVAGESGVGTISAFDASPYPTTIAAEVKDFDAGDHTSPELGGTISKGRHGTEARDDYTSCFQNFTKLRRADPGPSP